MTQRRIPIIPTVVVVAAAAVMVALGFWQLGRADEKTAQIARYSQTDQSVAPRELTREGVLDGEQLYSPVTLDCNRPLGIRSTAGTSAEGAKGFAHVAECFDVGPQTVEAALGFSRRPQSPEWAGGRVIGILGPNGKVVADPPLADLEPLARPDPSDLPNNHLAYAGQWFFFALTALLIYGFALRKKWRERD
ncbi:SURF1 family cytochrome oxidase biogenesis protein [Aurantiacibacter aquimixticola]|uniref:SURF1-like protein n=1 Tax=Aurantiacibacter aquimixticola TaxID=1958945 RepID=A0A419RQA5_9SPHN|nr:SURF1 family cytochrome oxidase biogenesis protein [Aurantiacibacter aquimixticola]RJY08002.1 SURF1 family protein [Aurantiacibacter aquimixticola]